MMIMTQNYELVEVNQLFYRKQYMKTFRSGVLRVICPFKTRKVLLGYNLIGHDTKGRESLIGTFDSKQEVISEMFRLNLSDDYVKVTSGIDFYEY